MNLRPVTVLLLAVALSAQAADRNPASKTRAEQRPAGDIVVNDSVIKADELRLAITDRQAAGTADSPQLAEAVREQLIRRELLVQEARKAGLDKQPEVQTRIATARQEILARQFLARWQAENAINETDAQAAYARLKQRSGDSEFKLRQIFVASEEDAKAVLVQLAVGERFDVVATTWSKDETSRAKGGDLGWHSPLQLQPHILAAVAPLKKGELTRPAIKGPNGWHVILVEDQRPFTLPAYEQLAPQIRRDLQREKIDAFVTGLRKQATVR
jgi:peptidyl-prolyl cis-trans isomerase C